MNQYLTRLSPLERRFVVGVAVVAFVVVNLIFVWPHFGDRAIYTSRLERARKTISTYQTAIDKSASIEKQVKTLENEGAPVPQEDQAIEFLRTINNTAAMNGVNIVGNNRQPVRTNQFFIEQSQAVSSVSGDKELVNFLYTLGAGNSMIRVRDLSMRRDPSGTQINANMKLVASYQKKTPTRTAAPPATASTAPAPTASTASAPNSKIATPKKK
jgi:hypothetical protein